MLKIFKSRLGSRLFALLLLGLVSSFGVLTYLILEREKALITDFGRRESTLLAESITTDIFVAMLEKDPSFLKQMVDGHNGSRNDITVGIFRNDGSLYYGKGGYQIPPEILSSPDHKYMRLKGRLLFLESLRNEESCHRCHSPLDKLRGVVGVSISTAKADKEVAETAKRIVFFGFVIALLSGVGLILSLRTMVLKPLLILKDGTEKVRSGDLAHRIDIQERNEFGDLASTFNRMTDRIENAHHHLEEAVRKKTRELSVITELSVKVFIGEHTLSEIIKRFLDSIADDLGYKYCNVCLIDKETGVWSEFKRGLKGNLCSSEFALPDNHPFVKILKEARPAICKSGDIGFSSLKDNLAVIPILSHQKRRCRDINSCHYKNCPAFNSSDERCWLIEGTSGKSPKAVDGRPKIYGCFQCEAFPLIGVLIAGTEAVIEKSSFHSLEILTSEIASAVDNYRLMDEKRRDIRELIRLHDVSVESLKYLNLPELTRSIVSSAVSFAGADAAILYLLEDGKLRYGDSVGIDSVLLPLPGPHGEGFIARSMTEGRAMEAGSPDQADELRGLMDHHGFLYAASVPLRLEETTKGCLTVLKKNDFFMTDSQKAIISLYASQAGAAIRAAGMYGDIKQEKEFSDAIFNCEVAGVIVLDRDAVVIKMNRSGAEILQIGQDTLVGRTLSEVYPLMQNMLLVDQKTDKEMDIRLPDGTARPIGFTNSLLFDKNGVKEGMIIVFRDLTEIKELQAGMRRKHHFEAMGKVISGVAHEIRNPLFGIQAIAQILEREVESTQHQVLISALLKESNRVRNLIDELLLYSRPSKLNPIDVDLEIFLAELEELIKLKNNDVMVSVKVPPRTLIRADKDKVRQVLLNLADNALGASSTRIEINAEQEDNAVIITLKDNGTGIKPDDLEKIFDPFFTTKKDGTGLGLPICKKIIEEHGGSLDIRNVSTGGAVVQLVFKRGG